MSVSDTHGQHDGTKAEKVPDIDEQTIGSSSDEGAVVEERDIKRKQIFKGGLLFWLAYQSTGVIYGDIGTSPLYVYSSTFSSAPSYDDLLGALSLIIWAMTLIVTVKYVFIVLCADDEGEGGTFAIYSLLSRYMHITHRDPKTKATVRLQRYTTNEIGVVNRSLRAMLEKSQVAHGIFKALAVFGVSLVMADGVLTPAQSVLGAIQGLAVVDSTITTSTIVGVTCAILVVLFLLQPLGIARLGTVFAPIVIIWLLFNLCFGIYNLALHDASVLKAFSPYYAGMWFVRNKTDGWKNLGGILLCFTGVEALFADLGAFSKRAIQMSWLCFCYPCLLLAYIGQAAYISDVPSAYANPFFNTVPPGMFYPSLVISILAAIVASQAMITSTFQLLSQVMNMSYFPQIKMIYTSDQFHGQVYIPVANWLLMIGTVIVTAVYNNTTSLGHAYGTCVILVTTITSCLVAVAAIIVWRANALLVMAVFIPFITLDALFLSSALTKVPEGAWFTLLLAAILASVFILWRFGKEQQWAAESKDRLTPSQIVVRNAATSPATLVSNIANVKFRGSEDFVEYLHPSMGGNALTTIRGLGIFFDKAGESVPTVYAQFLQKFEARPAIQVFLHVRALATPTVPEGERYSVQRVNGFRDCYRVVARHGYNEEIVTKELGSVVYNEIRAYIIASSAEHEPRTIGEDGNEDTVTSSSQRDTDARTAATLTALDAAYSTQTVYIVGKEQLRILSAPVRKWPAQTLNYMGTGAMRRLTLAIFMFLRDNTRTRVASMKVPVDKLVEVGFVKEI